MFRSNTMKNFLQTRPQPRISLTTQTLLSLILLLKTLLQGTPATEISWIYVLLTMVIGLLITFNCCLLLCIFDLDIYWNCYFCSYLVP